MKSSIEGFNQEYAVTLKKEVIEDGKPKVIQIDCTDLVILRWFVDFYPRMRKEWWEGREYAWLTHEKLREDLPILDISRKACIARMQKLVAFGILDYQIVKQEGKGTLSLYTFGENYSYLITSTDHGVVAQPSTGWSVNRLPRGGLTDHPVGGQPTIKDKSIIDKSIKDKSIKITHTRDCPENDQIIPDKPDYSKSFERFWQIYPKKVSKPQALKAWMKIRPSDELVTKILEAVEKAKRLDSRFREQRFIPYPASWLNSAGWENEYEDVQRKECVPDGGRESFAGFRMDNSND